MGEKHWGKGIVTEAINLIVEYAFSKEFKATRNNGHPVYRLEAAIFESNARSARVLEKNGFQLEGRMRKLYQKDGKLLDGLMYARVREDIMDEVDKNKQDNNQ